MKRNFDLSRLFVVVSVLFVAGCLGEDGIEETASRLIRRNYPDCQKIISINVDTVTFGDNLAYRIKQAAQSTDMARSMVEMYEDDIMEFSRYGKSGKSFVDARRKDLAAADSTLSLALAWQAALDSLKHETADIADTPVAYTICAQYNYVGNFVWIQLATDGTVLKISKRIEDMLLNPGYDMPGYYDLYCRYHRL